MRLLLVEDETKTVLALKQGLEEHGFAIDVAYDGEAGHLLASREQYDVVISDILMPKLNGLDLLRKLRQEGNATPVLLLSALDQTDDKVAGFEYGADDYLVKPFEFKELLARVKALARRSSSSQAYLGDLTFADVMMNLDTKECTRAGRKIELTPREFEFMVYLIKNRGRVVSKSEIAEKVWDIHFDTGTNVIEVYVNYLRNKIDKPFDKKLIHTVFGSGYILKDEVN
jgi:two-component system, OmpR family, copper resistance phosphate regulon response regulator CusR